MLLFLPYYPLPLTKPPLTSPYQGENLNLLYSLFLKEGKNPSVSPFTKVGNFYLFLPIPSFHKGRLGWIASPSFSKGGLGWISLSPLSLFPLPMRGGDKGEGENFSYTLHPYL